VHQVWGGVLLEGGSALVTFAEAETVAPAVQRMGRRLGLFGATEPVEVRVGIPEDEERMEALRAAPTLRAEPAEDFRSNDDGRGLAEGFPRESTRRYQSPNRHQRPPHRSPKARSRSRRKRRAERPRRRSRGRRRGRAESGGSASSASEGSGRGGLITEKDLQMQPVTTLATIPEPKKARGLGGFDSAPVVAETALALKGPDKASAPSGGRQVGTRGNWAEFATPDSRSYYVNIVTGEKTWTRPIGYDTAASRRGATAGGAPGQPGNLHSNVYVGSLPAGINDMTFWKMFEGFGTIISIKVVPEMYYGFVKFASQEQAQKSIDALNGAMCNGVQLAVRFANKDRG